MSGGPSRNRTGVQGFAVLCVTTPPSGLGELASLPRRSPCGQARGCSHPSFDEWRLARFEALYMSAGRLELEVY